jgi:hypothetical protein
MSVKESRRRERRPCYDAARMGMPGHQPPTPAAGAVGCRAIIWVAYLFAAVMLSAWIARNYSLVACLLTLWAAYVLGGLLISPKPLKEKWAELAVPNLLFGAALVVLLALTWLPRILG